MSRLPGLDAEDDMDPTEATDFTAPQTIMGELRQVTTNVAGGDLGQVADPEGDEVVRELNELEPAAKGRASPKPDASIVDSDVTKPTDAFSALLARVKSRVAETEGMKDDRRRAAGVLDAGGLTQRQREALRAKVLKWESETEWSPLACLLVIEHQVCACGEECHSMYGLFERQSRRLTSQEAVEGKLPAERLVRWCPEDLNEAGLASLPRQFTTRERKVSVCNLCGAGKGFQFTEIDWEKIK